MFKERIGKNGQTATIIFSYTHWKRPLARRRKIRKRMDLKKVDWENEEKEEGEEKYGIREYLRRYEGIDLPYGEEINQGKCYKNSIKEVNLKRTLINFLYPRLVLTLESDEKIKKVKDLINSYQLDHFLKTGGRVLETERTRIVGYAS